MPSGKKYDLHFFTATILEWKHLLADDRYKNMILDSLQYLVTNNRIHLHAYVIMSNHLHLLWHIVHPHKREDVQRDFLKFTAQMMLKDLRNNNSDLLNGLYVGAKDRKYQVWERNPLTVEIWSENVMKQKLDYIHNNPVKAGLVKQPEEYQFSSASYYSLGLDARGILTSCLM